jgi:hypothetical protein
MAFQYLTRKILPPLLSTHTKEPRSDAVPKLIWKRLRSVCLIHLLPNFQCGRQSEKGIKRLITAAGLAIGLVSLFACQAFTREHSTLARVTVYWRGEGSGGDHASSNGARYANAIALSIRRKFPTAAELSFLMRHAWP